MTTSRYAININDGRIVYRSNATDELVALYRKIDDETAAAIFNKEIDAMQVANAIMTKEYSSGVFNWKEFDKKRKELNMRTVDVEMVDDGTALPEDALKPDKRGEVMSLSEIKKSAAKSKAATSKKAEASDALADAAVSDAKPNDVDLKI